VIAEFGGIPLFEKYCADTAMSKCACAAEIVTIGTMMADETIFEKQKIQYVAQRKKQMNSQKNQKSQSNNAQRNQIGKQHNPVWIILVSFVGIHNNRFQNFYISLKYFSKILFLSLKSKSVLKYNEVDF